jgi:hypothetical protein
LHQLLNHAEENSKALSDENNDLHLFLEKERFENDLARQLLKEERFLANRNRRWVLMESLRLMAKSIFKWHDMKNLHQIRKSGLFFDAYYMSQCNDLTRSNLPAIADYYYFGAKEGKDPNPLFSSNFYLKNNADVENMDVNPLVHYILNGWHEGRKPHQKFNTKFYLKNNPDLAKVKINPLFHYLKYGFREGRLSYS